MWSTGTRSAAKRRAPRSGSGRSSFGPSAPLGDGTASRQIRLRNKGLNWDVFPEKVPDCRVVSVAPETLRPRRAAWRGSCPPGSHRVLLRTLSLMHPARQLRRSWRSGGDRTTRTPISQRRWKSQAVERDLNGTPGPAGFAAARGVEIEESLNRSPLSSLSRPGIVGHAEELACPRSLRVPMFTHCLALPTTLV